MESHHILKDWIRIGNCVAFLHKCGPRICRVRLWASASCLVSCLFSCLASCLVRKGSSSFSTDSGLAKNFALASPSPKDIFSGEDQSCFDGVSAAGFLVVELLSYSWGWTETRNPVTNIQFTQIWCVTEWGTHFCLLLVLLYPRWLFRFYFILFIWCLIDWF